MDRGYRAGEIMLLLMVLSTMMACGGGQALPTMMPTAAIPTATTKAPEPAATDPPRQNATATLPVAAALERAIQAALADYDYEQQRVVVEDVEIRGDELVIELRREGTPSGTDYFGQLGLIHGTIAAHEPDVATVRTFDVDARNGFVIRIDDLLAYFDGRIEFDAFRERWKFYE